MASRLLLPLSQRRLFSYSEREILRMHQRLTRKINVLRMYTEHAEFNYEQPKMTYNKKTGEVTIEEVQKNQKIIKSTDEVRAAKQALYDELGLEQDGFPKGADSANVNTDDLATKLMQLKQSEVNKWESDPSLTYASTLDWMRVDVGLLIMRPPIFLQMRDNAMNFLVERQKLMEEYWCNTKQFTDEFREVAKLNEDCLANNPYASRMNMDNYPTHRKLIGTKKVMVIDENGDEYEKEVEDYDTYCAASKQFTLVDPKCDNRRSLHFASEDRTYLLLKNRYSGEWEFPVGRLFEDQTFFRAKMELFKSLVETEWRIKFTSSSPALHTIREFTPDEVETDRGNDGMKGVRTFWFTAHHWRGEPRLLVEGDSLYEDWAWVPKRLMNEYLSREAHSVFVDMMATR